MGLGASLFMCWRLIPKKSGEGGIKTWNPGLMTLAGFEGSLGVGILEGSNLKHSFQWRVETLNRNYHGKFKDH